MLKGAEVKRIAAIHDLSGFGKSSLTVVIPLLSTMGMQVCPVPTAVLSTQTDGFTGYTFLDLTDNMAAYLEHWQTLDLKFDSVYTGYLGSFDQVVIIKPFIKLQKEKGAVILIDPVLGDNGILYNGISDKMVREMKSFIISADIITPNRTEADYLLDEKPKDFKDTNQTEEYIRKFEDITDANVIITSVSIKERYYNICFDRAIDDVFNIEFEMQDTSFPGTGDAFSSLLLGKLLKTGDFTLASFFATSRTSDMVKRSIQKDISVREGLPVEEFLCDINKEDIL
jgi:pyridoxine kinase